ncbi:MAG: SET domain-containing protein-lysine N-methyltransferase [Ferruginibacter sp.]
MITKTLTSPTVEVISHHRFAEVWLDASTNQKSLHAIVAINAGDVIEPFFAGSIQRHATYLTVQTGIDEHITLRPEFLQYINHSCEPNVFFDTTNMQLVCIKPLQPGDELSFFYPSTEWKMAQPFVCNCGSTDCLQLINGASHLSKETLSKYRLTDFIQQQVKQKISL